MGNISFLLQAANWIVFFIRLTISTDREVENDWKKQYHTYTFKHPNPGHDIYQIWIPEKWTFNFFPYTTINHTKLIMVTIWSDVS